MQVKIGCDIVQISRFEQKIKDGNDLLLANLFSTYELNNTKNIKSLAGMFAAKEAVVKALQLKPGNWNQIEIIKQENGKPNIKLTGLTQDIISSDISISHDGDYAVAMACFLLK